MGSDVEYAMTAGGVGARPPARRGIGPGTFAAVVLCTRAGAASGASVCRSATGRPLTCPSTSSRAVLRKALCKDALR